MNRFGPIQLVPNGGLKTGDGHLKGGKVFPTPGELILLPAPSQGQEKANWRIPALNLLK